MSRLRGGRVRHGQARAWISERLDAPLGSVREAALEAHLAACPDCRRTEAEYRANRAALRRLSAPVAPRDLAARTCAALEVEARRVGTPRAAPVLQARGARRSGGVAIGSLLTVALVAIVGVLLAAPVIQIIPGPKVGATPFTIAPVNLAYVGIEDQVVRLYHTRLDLACPPDSVSCPVFGPQEDQVVNLPVIAAVSGLTFNPADTRAAIAARSGVGATTTFYVVSLSGALPPSAGSSAGPPAWAASPAATGLASAATRASATAGPTRTPLVAGTKGSTATPRPSASTRPEKTARTAGAGIPRPVRSPASDARVGEVPVPARAAVGQASAALPSGAPALPSGEPALPSGEPAFTSSASTLPSNSPAMTTLPTVEAQAILQDVVPTGASAAWSADGTTLAFSAMPADGSYGSDIYVWHPGDAYALALTMDHASTFASWAGNRIVGSTLAPTPADPSVLVPQSFVLDPATGARRAIEGAALWLPSVDPTGRYVVAWSGTLATAGMISVPRQGQLVFAPWSSLDPFGLTAPGTVPGPSTVPIGTSPTAQPTDTPAGNPRDTSTTTATTVPPELSSGASAATGPAVALQALVPVDASAEPLAPQLKDWVVNWSPDGSAFAVWEGTAVGVTIGRLSLHAVDSTTAGLDGGSLLLGPVAACRAFSIGLDRLAWATPPDAQGLSELRVLLWGSFGRGEMQSGALQQQDIIPAF